MFVANDKTQMSEQKLELEFGKPRVRHRVPESLWVLAGFPGAVSEDVNKRELRTLHKGMWQHLEELHNQRATTSK